MELIKPIKPYLEKSQYRCIVGIAARRSFRKTPVRDALFRRDGRFEQWAPKPKYMLAEGDTYSKWPDDETYPLLSVNYVKLDRVPLFKDGWQPVVDALRSGNFYGTTGEVLFHSYGVSGSGAQSVYTAEVEWTFPMEFVELVWSDGHKVDREVIPATELAPFGSHEFKIPFDATGKKWVRFAAWDSAGDGAFTEPVALNSR